ncbi:hypothetical protein [Bacillus cereus]|nr:hypothetical protein [Bacillus cereus]
MKSHDRTPTFVEKSGIFFNGDTAFYAFHAVTVNGLSGGSITMDSECSQ